MELSRSPGAVPVSGHGNILIRQTALSLMKKLQGDVVFNGVDFGYNDDKIVLHDIKMYASQVRDCLCRSDRSRQDHFSNLLIPFL